mmetsp:Transcript_26952/g.80811  ORF Transcript_26952/g.80811 Transcript_26952/m.80811 type:complete len:140 (+) Transcript_26952:166-585(+)
MSGDGWQAGSSPSKPGRKPQKPVLKVTRIGTSATVAVPLDAVPKENGRLLAVKGEVDLDAAAREAEAPADAPPVDEAAPKKKPSGKKRGRPPKQPAPPAKRSSVNAEGLRELKQRHDAGALTDEEFAAGKARLLGLPPP